MSDETPEAAAEVPGTALEPELIPLEVIGERRGMFGAHDSGDTSGYGGLVQPVIMPPPSEPPFGDWRDDVAAALVRAAREAGFETPWEKVVVHRGEITFFLRREDLAGIARLLRDDAALRFELCSGVSGVHYPGDEGRELHVIYHLLSMTHNRRIRLEVTCPDADPHVPSVCGTYPTADWHERETYDFFGVVFDGHPGLTRIEMPDDWPGHPQRKDYPLGGIHVEYKGGTVPPPDQRRSYT